MFNKNIISTDSEEFKFLSELIDKKYICIGMDGFTEKSFPILDKIYFSTEFKNSLNKNKEYFSILLNNYMKYLFIFHIIELINMDNSVLDLIKPENYSQFIALIKDICKKSIEDDTHPKYISDIFTLFKIDHVIIKEIQKCIPDMARINSKIKITFPAMSDNDKFFITTINKHSNRNIKFKFYPYMKGLFSETPTQCLCFDMFDFIIDNDLKLDMYDPDNISSWFSFISSDRRINDAFDFKYEPIFLGLLENIKNESIIVFNDEILANYLLRLDETKGSKKFKDELNRYKLSILI